MTTLRHWLALTPQDDKPTLLAVLAVLLPAFIALAF